MAMHQKSIPILYHHIKQKKAIEARINNVNLDRFVEVYKLEDNLDDYKRIINIDGERKQRPQEFMHFFMFYKLPRTVYNTT